MQTELAYEEGYRDGLRFIFTLGAWIESIPKEIWDKFADEIKQTNKILKELREDE